MIKNFKSRSSVQDLPSTPDIGKIQSLSPLILDMESDNLELRRSKRLRFPSKILSSIEFEGPSLKSALKSKTREKRHVKWSPDVKDYKSTSSDNMVSNLESEDGEEEELPTEDAQLIDSQSVLIVDVAPPEQTLATGPELVISSVLETGTTYNNAHLKPGMLRKMQVKLVNENDDIEVPAHIPLLGHIEWQNCLVGYFLTKKVSFHYVKLWAKKVWGNDCTDIRSLDNGFYMFKMKDNDSLVNLLSSGPHFLGGKFIVLQKWVPGMEFKKKEFSSLPTWVNFFNVPLDMWTSEGLSFISSCIGTPLYMDKHTMDKSRLVYARVCVDIQAGYKVPKTFKIKLGYGTPIEIRVEIPWMPPKCTNCTSFGHASSNCPRHPPSLPKSSSRISGVQKGKLDDVRESKEHKRKKASTSVWVQVNRIDSNKDKNIKLNPLLRSRDVDKGETNVPSTSAQNDHKTKLAKKLKEFKEARSKGGIQTSNMFERLLPHDLESEEWPSLEAVLRPP